MVTGLMAGLLPGRAVASVHEPVEHIARAAVDALDNGQGGVATVDPGVRLARCGQALQTRVVRPGTVEVACPAPAWKLFVPVRVANQQQVVVLRHPVRAGQTLTAEDLDVVQRDVANVAQGLMVDPQLAAGRVARRHLQAGALLSTADLHAQKVIRRGDIVDLVTQRGSVVIRVQARASRDAAVGDSLLVENLSSRRSIQGTVAADGTVHVK